jgi:hypothetical protein
MRRAGQRAVAGHRATRCGSSPAHTRKASFRRRVSCSLAVLELRDGRNGCRWPLGAGDTRSRRRGRGTSRLAKQLLVDDHGRRKARPARVRDRAVAPQPPQPIPALRNRQFRQTRNDSWWARTNQTGSVCIAGQGRRDQRDPIRGAGVDRPTRRRRCLRLGPSGRVGMNAGQVHQRGRVAERAQDGGHAGACGRREATSIPRMSSIPAGSKAGSRARWIGKATILLPPRPTAACIARAAIVRPCGVAMEPG